MTSVTSAMWASAALRCGSFESSTRASVRSSRSRSRRASLRSAYCADAVGDLDVLALDDRPHGDLPARTRRLAAGGDGPADRGPPGVRVYARSDAPRPPADGPRRSAPLPLARDGDRADRRARPPSRSARGRGASVAPVVTTSSTSTIQRPAIGRAGRRGRDRERVRDVGRAVRAGRGRNWAVVARVRSRTARHGRPSVAPRRPGDAARPGRSRARGAASAWTGTGHEDVAAGAGPPPARGERLAERLARAGARRAYLSAWSACRTTPLNGAHHSSWRSGRGRSVGSPSGVPGGQRRAGRRARGGRPRRSAGPRAPQPGQGAGQREVEQRDRAAVSERADPCARCSRRDFTATHRRLRLGRQAA